MSVLAVYPASPSPELAQLLDLGGYVWKPVASDLDVEAHEPDEGWVGAVVQMGEAPEAAWSVVRALRGRTDAAIPLLLVIRGIHLGELEMRDDLFDDFCLDPFHPREVEARLRHLLVATGVGSEAEIIEHGALILNLETYEAAVGGHPLDLTYMEYELLRFLAANPGKVFTREVLLNRVWGYEYYGGARTVDVHVRRLRAKLGEENASLIQTVRSVGYRFGQSRWR